MACHPFSSQAVRRTASRPTGRSFPFYAWSGERRTNSFRKMSFFVRHNPFETSQIEVKLALRQTPLPTAFLRNNLTSQVVFPIRAHLKTSPEQLGAECDYTTHLLPDNTPKSFSLTPHASASPSAPTPGSECSAVVRNSYAGSRLSSFSIFSTASSLSESIISATSGRGSGRSVRKVRQAFNPVLPDELLISLGEKLIILQSFDDGWCVVGRENGFLMSQSKSLLIHKGVGTASGGANTDLGMVPAWCFLKPVKGLRAERPVRSSSLSVMVQTDRSGMDRNDTISWSNF